MIVKVIGATWCYMVLHGATWYTKVLHILHISHGLMALWEVNFSGPPFLRPRTI